MWWKQLWSVALELTGFVGATSVGCTGCAGLVGAETQGLAGACGVVVVASGTVSEGLTQHSYRCCLMQQ